LNDIHHRGASHGQAWLDHSILSGWKTGFPMDTECTAEWSQRGLIGCCCHQHELFRMGKYTDVAEFHNE